MISFSLCASVCWCSYTAVIIPQQNPFCLNVYFIYYSLKVFPISLSRIELYVFFRTLWRPTFRCELSGWALSSSGMFNFPVQFAGSCKAAGCKFGVSLKHFFVYTFTDLNKIKACGNWQYLYSLLTFVYLHLWFLFVYFSSIFFLKCIFQELFGNRVL